MAKQLKCLLFHMHLRSHRRCTSLHRNATTALREGLGYHRYMTYEGTDCSPWCYKNSSPLL